MPFPVNMGDSTYTGQGKKMLKVFLVEDEAIIREGLREIIPWQQYGFTVVGDAGDGEQALPMIREARPDVLIRDIRLPLWTGWP